MTDDYRIDVRSAITLPGMAEGRPRAERRTIVEIQLSRYGQNGKELKPELLWGPTIVESASSYSELLAQIADVFERVVQAHENGQPTQVQHVGISA